MNTYQIRKEARPLPRKRAELVEPLFSGDTSNSGFAAQADSVQHEIVWREFASGRAVAIERIQPGHIDSLVDSIPELAAARQRLRTFICSESYEAAIDPAKRANAMHFGSSDNRPKRPRQLTPEEIAGAEKLHNQLARLRAKGTPGELEQISANRAISIAALERAQSLGVLRFGEVCGQAAWVLTDYSERCAEARRLDNELFPAINDENGAERFGARKVHTLAGSKKNWLVGLRVDRGPAFEILEASEMIFVPEGGPDYLALWDFVLERQLDMMVLPVAILGRGISEIHPSALELCKDKRIRIFAHVDKDGGGLAEARKWARQFQEAGCAAVEIAHLEFLRKADGSPVKDVNDLVALDPALIPELEQLFSLEPQPRLEMLHSISETHGAGAEDYSRLFEEVRSNAKEREGEEESPAAQLPAIEDSTEFLEAELPLPTEIVKGVLHRGLKLEIGGSSKTYKTWSAIDLAVSIATGAPWLDFDSIAGRVLYINLEIPAPFFQRRLKKVCNRKKVKLSHGALDVWNLRGYAVNLPTLIAVLAERIVSGQYVLIIIDPIYKVYSGKEESSVGEMAVMLGQLEVLTRQLECAIAWTAHFSKGNQAAKQSIDRISGHGVLNRDPDSIITFTRHEEDKAFTVEMTLRNVAEIADFVVRFDDGLMIRDAALDPAALKQPPRTMGRPKKAGAREILGPLIVVEKNDPPGLFWKDWFEAVAESLELSQSTFERRRRDCARDGLVFQSKTDDRWQLTAKYAEKLKKQEQAESQKQ